MKHHNIILKAYRITASILDTIFPKICLSCGCEGHYICRECFVKIPIKNDFHCLICGRRSPTGKKCFNCESQLSGLFVASDWNNMLIRRLIYEYKYRFVKELSKPLAEIIIKFINQNFKIELMNGNKKTESKIQSINIDKQNNKIQKIDWQKTILIPVPLHKRRLIWRGFNQSELITDIIAEYLKVPVIKNLIFRKLNTMPQMKIKNNAQRQNNIINAFATNKLFDGNLIKGKVIILIDDVCTTSATINECAKSIKYLKPKAIWGLVIARG